MGGETGNPIAVDDAFAAPLRGLTVYGKSTQDGTPTPDAPVPIVSAGDGGTIVVTLSDKNGKTQTLTLPTPNGLPGIPVTSGGNYTDTQGQQWVCDEIDLEREVKVQRVYKVDVDGENVKFVQADIYANLTPSGLPFALIGNGQKTYAVSTFTNLGWYYNSESRFLYLIKDNISDKFNESCKKQLGKVYYVLANPIETPLTPAEIAAYKALTTYAPDTVVQASDGAGIKLGYQKDVNLATNWKPTVNQLKTDVDAKINQSDALTLEEIMASTGLSKKVASAEAVKSIKNNVGSIKSGGFYSEKNKGNTMPADYGGFIRISGGSWPGSYYSDTYYVGVGAGSEAFLGVQINGAKQITWVQI